MPTFPKGEAEVIDLAQAMRSGLAAHTDVYPAPPETPTELADALTALQQAKDAVIAARAAAEAATTQKAELLADLVSRMKKDLRYAEIKVDGSDEQLKLIGWGGRKEPTPMPVPGQVRSLLVYPQGEGWLDLEWQAPIDGGGVTLYEILRRPRQSGSGWQEAGTAVACSARLENQPRGVELEYVVAAVNKSGSGLASNMVMVVL